MNDGLGEACMTDSFLKYLQFEKRLSPNTSRAYSNDLTQFTTFLSSSSPGLFAKDADYNAVRAWIIQLVEEGIDPASVNRKIACLRSFFKFLMKQEVITKDPMAKISVLKMRKKLPSFVKEADMNNLLDHAPFTQDLEGLRDKLILEMFYATGIRLSELITLKENQLDLRNRTIKVLGKRNKERIVPFAKSIVHSIEAYKTVRNKEVALKDHGYLVCNRSWRALLSDDGLSECEKISKSVYLLGKIKPSRAASYLCNTFVKQRC